LVEKAHECSEILWAFEHLAGNKETIATELKERRAELKSTYALSVEETDAEFERIRDRMRPKDEETRIARYAELDEQKAAKLKEMEQAYQENGKSLVRIFGCCSTATQTY
jgi:exonuclease VII large subunit